MNTQSDDQGSQHNTITQTEPEPESKELEPIQLELKEAYPFAYDALAGYSGADMLEDMHVKSYTVMPNIYYFKFNQSIKATEGTQTVKRAFYYDDDETTIQEYVSDNFGLYMPDDYPTTPTYIGEVVAIDYKDDFTERTLFVFPDSDVRPAFVRSLDLNNPHYDQPISPENND